MPGWSGFELDRANILQWFPRYGHRPVCFQSPHEFRRVRLTVSDSQQVLPRAAEDARDIETRRRFADSTAPLRQKWLSRNSSYHVQRLRLLRKLVHPGARVLDIGCGTGEFLAALEPAKGVGLDFSPKMVELARARYPGLTFLEGIAEDLPVSDKFDVVLLGNMMGSLQDVWTAFRQLHKVCDADTRIIVTYYNFFWEPLIRLAEYLGLKMAQPRQNWLPLAEIRNNLDLAGFQSVKHGRHILCPFNIPVLAGLLNRYIAPLPGIQHLCLEMYTVARLKPRPRDYTVSVVIPCRNEAANIDPLVARTPDMGLGTEIIFVDGHSTDGTVEKIESAIARAPGGRSIRLLHQGDGVGKADAVHIGFRQAAGDILMILDADVTVQPEDLPKFYLALAEGHGEFANGTRLVYPMDDKSMRLLNLLGNKFFSVLLSWLLGQRVRDTLCGTKVFFRRHYAGIMGIRDTIGRADPFGDFELLFGASQRNLCIVELPVRYRERTYGETKISRFRNGWQLLRLCFVVWRRFKLL
jgi:SAM-dependent methyltransferase